MIVELKVENHNSAYELENIINLFKPYMDPAIHYIVISQVIGTKTTTKIIQKGEGGSETIEESSVDVKEDSLIRQGLKKTLYTVLSKLTGRQMPWGVLTGIRPTKVVHTYKNANYNDGEIHQKLMEDYFISREKADLMIEIASKEEAILSKNKEDEVSLYIGIPFCPTRCLYCSFTSYSLKEKGDLVEAYLDALIKEIQYVAGATKGRPIRSLYIGGGTPTSLSELQLERLLGELDRCFNIGQIEEYTVEAGRPDTLNRNKLKILKKYKVSRISINPQTMNQQTLDKVGRSHSVEDIVKIFNMARGEGHGNINMDLIIGLPGEGTAEVANTMERISRLSPESITVHTLAIKRASRLKEEIKAHTLTKVEEIHAMLEITAKGAKSMGMTPYYMYRQKDTLGNFENVGYAVSAGTESIYNIQMIAEQQTIIAMGAGAVTKIVSDDERDRIQRIPNVRNLEQYIHRIDEMINRKTTRGTVHKSKQ